jgi:hypothetical protein
VTDLHESVLHLYSTVANFLRAHPFKLVSHILCYLTAKLSCFVWLGCGEPLTSKPQRYYIGDGDLSQGDDSTPPIRGTERRPELDRGYAVAEDGYDFQTQKDGIPLSPMMSQPSITNAEKLGSTHDIVNDVISAALKSSARTGLYTSTTNVDTPFFCDLY